MVSSCTERSKLFSKFDKILERCRQQSIVGCWVGEVSKNYKFSLIIYVTSLILSRMGWRKIDTTETVSGPFCTLFPRPTKTHGQHLRHTASYLIFSGSDLCMAQRLPRVVILQLLNSIPQPLLTSQNSYLTIIIFSNYHNYHI